MRNDVHDVQFVPFGFTGAQLVADEVNQQREQSHVRRKSQPGEYLPVEPLEPVLVQRPDDQQVGDQQEQQPAHGQFADLSAVDHRPKHAVDRPARIAIGVFARQQVGWKVDQLGPKIIAVLPRPERLQFRGKSQDRDLAPSAPGDDSQGRGRRTDKHAPLPRPDGDDLHRRFFELHVGGQFGIGIGHGLQGHLLFGTRAPATARIGCAVKALVAPQPFLQLAMGGKGGHLRHLARQQLLQPFARATEVVDLLQADDEVSAAVEPGQQGADLVDLKVQRPFRTQIEHIQALQGDGIVREHRRLQPGKHRPQILLSGFELRQRRQGAAHRRSQRHTRVVKPAHALAGGLGADPALVIQQTGAPGEVVSGGAKHGDKEAFGGAGGQFEQHRARRTGVVLAGGQLDCGHERRPVVLRLERNREPTALRHDAVVAHEHVETHGGVARTGQRQEQNQHGPPDGA